MSKDFELRDSFQRTDSICSIRPQTKLLHALESHNFEEFEKILKSALRDGCLDLHYVYEKPRLKSILDIACSFCNNSKFVDVLIKNGVDVNLVNSIHKKSPLHFAIEFADIDTVELLIDYRHTDINNCDQFGNTPLHLAASLNKVEIIEKLLQHPAVKVNEINRKSQTPLHLALRKNNRASVIALLLNIDVDLDDIKDFRDQTCIEMISNKFPDIELRTIRSRRSTPSLFSTLKDRDLRGFKELVGLNKNNLDENDGHSTCLQYACQYGLLEAVQTLLNYGADANKTCVGNNKYPIMIAGFEGYLNIVRTLVGHGSHVIYDSDNDGTVLHAVLEGIMYCKDKLGSTDEPRNHVKCLEYLLKNVSQDILNINDRNMKDDTALHLAVTMNHDGIIRLLLDNGAYIGYRNKSGYMPITRMNAKLFKNYLDDCITTNGLRPVDASFEVIYNYQFLAPPKTCEKHGPKGKCDLVPETDVADTYDVISETEPLVEMSKIADLRHLLNHPILTSFLNLKWYRIRKYFWVNVTFYVSFWLFLTCYIMSAYGVPRNAERDSRDFEVVKRLSWFPTLVLCGIFCVREFFQLAISPKRYVTSFENLLEIGLIAFTFLILFCNSHCKSGEAQIAAFAILLSWTELVLLIGRHPLLSTNIEMFKVVCCNFLKFLAWYSILILAFAFSFYLLFKDRVTVPNAEANEQFFSNPEMSIFKSVIMLTGEFDAGSIPFDFHPGTSHLLFILFVFLIAIVLFNLLNGLAVSDTQTIKSDAELVSNVCRAKLITYIETMAIGDPFKCLNFVDKMICLCCFVPMRRSRSSRSRHIKMFYTRVNLFPKYLVDLKAHVRPNEGNKVDIEVSWGVHKYSTINPSCFIHCTEWYIDPAIMKAAKEILNAKSDNVLDNSYNEGADLMRRYCLQMEENKLKLESLEESSNRTQRQIAELVTLLKQKI